MPQKVASCDYGWMHVCGYVWYLELSREPMHVERQMRHQIIGLGDRHCLETIRTFQLTSHGQFCACAVDI